MKAKVHVFLKPGVLDVQGKAVEAALHGMGWSDASEVRIGKLIEMNLAATDADAAREEAESMARRLLANPVIESFTVEIAN